jgi:hypothetical protein
MSDHGQIKLGDVATCRVCGAKKSQVEQYQFNGPHGLRAIITLDAGEKAERERDDARARVSELRWEANGLAAENSRVATRCNDALARTAELNASQARLAALAENYRAQLTAEQSRGNDCNMEWSDRLNVSEARVAELEDRLERIAYDRDELREGADRSHWEVSQDARAEIGSLRRALAPFAAVYVSSMDRLPAGSVVVVNGGEGQTPIPVVAFKAARAAVPYAFIVPVLAEVARGVGYALALHGSMTNDLDLVAVPWTDDAGTPEDLVDALGAAIRWTREGDAFGPEHKPHGRIAWKIPLLAGASIDLSVMPRITPGKERP